MAGRRTAPLSRVTERHGPLLHSTPVAGAGECFEGPRDSLLLHSTSRRSGGMIRKTAPLGISIEWHNQPWVGLAEPAQRYRGLSPNYFGFARTTTVRFRSPNNVFGPPHKTEILGRGCYI